MRAVIIAFSMYSRIPMPMFMWEEEDRKRALWFFPLIGAVIGIVFYSVYRILDCIGTGAVFRAACLTAVPVLITGGIHLDGFLDTCDARASCGDREKKLEILKDSNSGAFAVTGGILYLLFYFAACTELTAHTAAACSVTFVMSRALSGFGVCTLPEARKHGMLADFIRDMRKRKAAVIMLSYFAVAVLILFNISGVIPAFAVVLVSCTVFLYYRVMAIREFGGVTGDLAGFFLQICELALLFTVVLVERIPFLQLQ